LSFSSTVFAVKVLEEKGEMNAVYGRIAIGVLIMQDIAAVALAVSTGKALRRGRCCCCWAFPAAELARHLLGIKDLFLGGFFLTRWAASG
jgi:hypothetical protein